MLLSLFSNPNITHLIEIFSWMLGSFLIGLYFGRQIKSSEKDNKLPEKESFDELNITDDVPKIRAIMTFERGGKEMQKSTPSDSYTNGLNFKRIGIATLETKDSLQQLKGIGSAIEDKLNNIGIFTFKQISNFNSKDIEKITELIKFFPGRIERDDWVGQAFKKLHNNYDNESTNN